MVTTWSPARPRAVSGYREEQFDNNVYQDLLIHGYILVNSLKWMGTFRAGLFMSAHDGKEKVRAFRWRISARGRLLTGPSIFDSISWRFALDG